MKSMNHAFSYRRKNKLDNITYFGLNVLENWRFLGAGADISVPREAGYSNHSEEA